MIIRKLNENDITGHITCSSQAFCYCAGEEDFSAKPDERIIAAFLDDNKTLTAEIEISDFKNAYCGSVLKCAAVGGVASRPEYRRKGAVRALFDNLFNEQAEEKGYEISILYPFSTTYYRLFGYETAGEKMRLEVPFSELKNIPRNFNAELFTGEQLDSLLEVYNKFANLHNLSFIRDSAGYFSADPLKSARWTYLWKNENNEYRGYITYHINRPEGKVYVEEIGWLDKESLLGLIGFIRCYDGNQKTVVFENVPVNCPIINFVENEQVVLRSLCNMGSVRILNLPSVLSKKEWPAEKGSFVMKIEDSIEKNRGTFKIEYAGGKAEITKDDSLIPETILNESAASRVLLVGTTGPEELDYLPGAKVINRNSDFFKAYTYSVPFFVDGF